MQINDKMLKEDSISIETEREMLMHWSEYFLCIIFKFKSRTVKKRRWTLAQKMALNDKSAKPYCIAVSPEW